MDQAPDDAGEREPPQSRRSQGPQVSGGTNGAAFLRRGSGRRVRLRAAQDLTRTAGGRSLTTVKPAGRAAKENRPGVKTPPPVTKRAPHGRLSTTAKRSAVSPSA